MRGADRDIREHAERLLRTRIKEARRDYNWWHGVAKLHPTEGNKRQEEAARRRLLDSQRAHEDWDDGEAT